MCIVTVVPCRPISLLSIDGILSLVPLPFMCPDMFYLDDAHSSDVQEQGKVMDLDRVRARRLRINDGEMKKILQQE